MASFPAKYAGRCSGCDNPIEIEDRVVYVGDVLVHEECAPSFRPVTSEWDQPYTVCPKCFLTSCDCDQ